MGPERGLDSFNVGQLLHWRGSQETEDHTLHPRLGLEMEVRALPMGRLRLASGVAGQGKWVWQVGMQAVVHTGHPVPGN